MTIALAAFAVAELVLIGYGIWQRRGLARIEKRRVVIHTIGRGSESGSSTQGVLVGTYPDCLVLDAPRHLHEANPADLPGQMVILREHIDRIQVL